MPYGIIDVKSDTPLAGTELLIKSNSSTDEDVVSPQLKRVSYKASRLSSTVMRHAHSNSVREPIPSSYRNHPKMT
jgi:hypothetical protein